MAQVHYCVPLNSDWLITLLPSSIEIRLGNPKAAAHVAVTPSVLVTVKC